MVTHELQINDCTHTKPGYKVQPVYARPRLVTENNSPKQIKDSFISTAAHELRVPSTEIVGISEFLLNQVVEEAVDVETQKRILGIVLENTPKLDLIIDTLLDVKRFQSQQASNLQRCLCRVEDFVVDALWPLQERNPDSRVTVNVSNEKARAFIDLERIQRVLVELVTNAIKFSSGKQVTVSGHITGNSYCLSVADHGAGIAPEQIAAICRPFYRVDSTSSAPEGLGLGLTWAKGVIVAHGGQLLVDSEVGQGTKVSMLLPLWNKSVDVASRDVNSWKTHENLS